MGATTFPEARLQAQDDKYREAVEQLGPALDRLVRAYEANPEERRDLLHEIQMALWRSFAGFDGRCSMRTWVYRVAHNTATSHSIRRRSRFTFASLDEIEAAEAGKSTEHLPPILSPGARAQAAP